MKPTSNAAASKPPSFRRLTSALQWRAPTDADKVGVFIYDNVGGSYYANFLGQLATAVQDFRVKASFMKGAPVVCRAERRLASGKTENIEFAILPSMRAKS